MKVAHCDQGLILLCLIGFCQSDSACESLSVAAIGYLPQEKGGGKPARACRVQRMLPCGCVLKSQVTAWRVLFQNRRFVAIVTVSPWVVAGPIVVGSGLMVGNLISRGKNWPSNSNTSSVMQNEEHIIHELR